MPQISGTEILMNAGYIPVMQKLCNSENLQERTQRLMVTLNVNLTYYIQDHPNWTVAQVLKLLDARVPMDKLEKSPRHYSQEEAFEYILNYIREVLVGKVH